MSLDVYLQGKTEKVSYICQYCQSKYERKETEEFYEANITHNLAPMADEAGIYEYLWRPEEIGIIKAAQLIEPLRSGLELLKRDPKRFEIFNPDNGWGSYSDFVPWVENYLNASIKYPDADVSVSR
jgi:hypothetical protein